MGIQLQCSKARQQEILVGKLALQWFSGLVHT